VSRLRWWRRHDEIPVVELNRTSPIRFAIVFIVIVAIAIYFGFTKHVPFKHGFRLNAQFASALNIKGKSPVRIAGVDVGKVTHIKRQGSTALVSMEIEGRGLPLHSDATVKIRPRIFLEGNWFVELQPGTSATRVVPSGYTIPITHTADPVQLDQVLDALNTDTRANLQTFLVEYGAALTAKPTPAENAEQSPEVSGLNMAQALNKAYRLGPEALRKGTIVNQAVSGTETHDLSQLFASIEKVSAELDVHEQALGELVGHFNTSCTSSPRRGPACARRSPSCRARCAAPNTASPNCRRLRPRSGPSRWTSSPASNRSPPRMPPPSRGSNRCAPR
jgi:phospholipid/cholesterol/gamma-HCH transport system substrate-binding protein